MTRRAVVLCALLLTAALLAPAIATADGDPASDVLLGLNVFYPYGANVAAPVRVQLDAQTAAAKRAGFPIKVALIAAPTDLGVIPSLFGKPMSYARFLDQEISFGGPQPLLVVMAAGYGVQGVKAPDSRALRAVARPTGPTSTDLARAAVIAVDTLAAASGHPLGGTPRPGSGADGGSDRTLVLIVLVSAAILVTTALLVLRARRSSTG